MAELRLAGAPQVNSKYNQQMEELKAQLDSELSKREGSTLGKASQVATAAAIPLRIYGQSSLTIRQVRACPQAAPPSPPESPTGARFCLTFDPCARRCWRCLTPSARATS